MRTPLIHFLLLGSLLFFISHRGSLRGDEDPAPSDPSQTIVIGADELAQMREEWTRSNGSAPDERALQALIDRAINDEILYREALRLDMHLADPVIQQRLALNMRFLNDGQEEPSSGDAERIDAALALGMVRSDIVVRRRLIQQMEALIGSMATTPTLEESRAYVLAHPERFTSSARFRLSYHFSPDLPSSGRLPPHTASETRPHTGLFTQQQLGEVFGEHAQSKILELEPGSWSGALASGAGTYWIRVDELVPGRPIAFEHVRHRVIAALSRERTDRARTRGLERLRDDYLVEVGDHEPM
jgi:hypothetical protein